MSAAPLVSLVVPSRGGAARLPVLFDALSQQSATDWEAIVVLDGDVDDSADVVSTRARELPVRTIVFPENRGRSAALNAGFEAARGEVLVRCDDDLVPSPEYVARRVAAHADREVGVIGLVRNIFPETPYARVYGRAWDVRYREEAYTSPSDQAWKHWGANVSVSRRSWERVGPYDTSFRSYGWEDVDWGYRMHFHGIPVVIEAGLETEHRIAATTTSTRALRAYYSGAARLRFEHKHGRPSLDPAPTRIWDRGVALLAARLDEERSAKAGRIVDQAVRILPSRVAAKSVALVVEASARAGYARGEVGTTI